MEQLVIRREQKYVLNLMQAESLYHRLCMVLQGDPYNGNKPYLVRSLYFDTLENKDYEEKMGGIEERKKIRLRVYDADSDTAKLELKEKQGQDQVKRSMTISRDDARRLTDGEYDALDKYESELAQDIKNRMEVGRYRPACIVEYQRRAFAVPTNDIRITFDSNIASNEGNFDLFDKALQTYPVTPPDSVCLEVKYNHFLLHYIKEMLRLDSAEETSNSKYCLARKFGLG